MTIELPLDRTAQATVRPLSTAAFKSQYALEALLLIADAERFYPGEIAAATGCQPNFAGAFVRRLADAGLVERLAADPGQLRHYYRKRPSPLWSAVVALVEGLLGDETAASVTRMPQRRGN
jgi:hypothetical protein